MIGFGGDDGGGLPASLAKVACGFPWTRRTRGEGGCSRCVLQSGGYAGDSFEEAERRSTVSQSFLFKFVLVTKTFAIIFLVFPCQSKRVFS